MRGIVFAALALFTTPAMAQQTNCMWMGSTWSCNTQQPLDLAKPGGGLDWGLLNPPRTTTPYNASEQGRQQADTQGNRDVWVRCRKRWNDAIDARDFDLANALVKGCPAAP